MPKVNCKICNQKFYAKPSWLKKGWGQYCSIDCHHKSLKKGKIVKCHICQEEVYKSLKALNGSRSKKFFCGKSCQTIWRNSILYVGSKHGNWKGGEYIYRNVLIKSDIPKRCNLCQNDDFRILSVHHLDKDRKNNDVKNLVWLCHNCHFLVHHYKEEELKVKKVS